MMRALFWRFFGLESTVPIPESEPAHPATVERFVFRLATCPCGCGSIRPQVSGITAPVGMELPEPPPFCTLLTRAELHDWLEALRLARPVPGVN